LRPYPAPHAGDPVRGAKAFLDSDLGSKTHSSLPRAVWDAIPVLFPDLLPEGWEGLGLIPRPEDPRGPPVGVVRAHVLGVEMYTTNCALCHAGKIAGQLLVGAPNPDLDIQYLMWVLGQALRSESFTLDAIDRVSREQGRALSTSERMAIRGWLVLARRKANSRPAKPFAGTAGPGRSDNLNGYKRMFGLPDSERPAMVDLVSVYNQRLKSSALVDGSITGDHAVRIMLTELQKGRPARDSLMHREVFEDLVAWMEGPLEPPKFPFAHNAQAAERGHGVYAQNCARCHGQYAPDAVQYPNLRISISSVGTDPERALSMSQGLADALEGYDFSDYLKIDPKPTYVPPPLAGIWASPPYLHNGSVPTLWHLLHPEQRPAAFYRRWSDYDAERVGFLCPDREVDGQLECDLTPSQRAHDPRTVIRFDARLPGNSNRGHVYGALLPESDKVALLEYLKTL
jgi:mono/diheme cytochrome c family protein